VTRTTYAEVVIGNIYTVGRRVTWRHLVAPDLSKWLWLMNGAALSTMPVNDRQLRHSGSRTKPRYDNTIHTPR